MNRRNFMKASVIGAGTSLLAPDLVFAESAQGSLAGGVYYTKEATGRWKGKEAGHAPSIDVVKSEGKIVINVVTAHEMKEYEHYIVKHVLLDKNYKFLDEHMFNPMKD